jgi:hypothetical protein
MKRALLVGAMSLAVLVSPALAQAVPSPEPSIHAQSQDKPRPRYTKTTQLTSTEKKQVDLGARIIHYSVSKAGGRRTMDYRKADKYDQGHPTARRRVVAGFILGGGKVGHISKAELKRVRAYIPKGNPYKGLPKNVFGVPQCEGVSKTVKYHPVPSRNFRIYMNSCDTSLTIFTMTSISVTMGVIGAALAFNPASAALAFVVGVGAGLVALGAAWLGYLQDTSGSSSTWLRLKYAAVWAGRQ